MTELSPTGDGRNVPPPTNERLLGEYKQLVSLPADGIDEEQKIRIENIKQYARDLEAEHSTHTNQEKSRDAIIFSAILFSDRMRELLKKKDKDKIVDPVGIELAREIPKLMEEYLQSVEKTESLIKSARFRSTDAQEFREKVVAYDQARRNRHNALLSRINMAIRLARGLGIEPIIYRTLDTDTSSIDRDTAVDYSKIVVDLYGNGRF